MNTAETVQNHLKHHWALDASAAVVMAERIDEDGKADQVLQICSDPTLTPVLLRDIHRERIGKIFTGDNETPLIVLGPCSLDTVTDTSPLLDFVEQLQAENPTALFAMRANFAKPRTGNGWTGLWNATDPSERLHVFDLFERVFERGIPILSEVTHTTQLGALAPWMSGVWLGARDMTSTTLRAAVSAIHLPVGIKNGMVGDEATIVNSFKAIASNSADNDGSGVDLGTIAKSRTSRGIATDVLPVGTGNKQIAVIARGHELDSSMNRHERRVAALDHLSSMCVLADSLGAAVLLDGTHGVPPMFDIDSKNPERVLGVMEEINKAVIAGEIDQPSRLRGLIAEVSTTTGITDPNFVIDSAGKQRLSRLVREMLTVIEQQPEVSS